MNGFYGPIYGPPDYYLNEVDADRYYYRILWTNRSELCLSGAGYALIKDIVINNRGVTYMAIIFKGEDGQIQEVRDAQPLTLDQIDERIGKVKDHLQELELLRTDYIGLKGSDTTAAPASDGTAAAASPADASNPTPPADGQPAPAAAATPPVADPAPAAPAAPPAEPSTPPAFPS